MRLSFRTDRLEQKPVNDAQRELRRARPAHAPVAPIALGVIILAALAWGAYAWATRSRVYTYGVVTTAMDLFHAPVRSQVVGLYAEPGDHVTADSVLYVLASEDAQADLKEAQEDLSRQHLALDLEVGHDVSVFADPQRLRDLAVARDRIEALERDSAADEPHQTAAAARREQETARQAREIEYLTATHDASVTRLEAVRKLVALDAAGAADQAAAEGAAREAAFRLDAARIDEKRIAAEHDAAAREDKLQRSRQQELLGLAKGNATALGDAYDQATGQRSRDRDERIAGLKSRVAALEARIAFLKRMAGPTEVRAVSNGVVMDVAISVGSTVPKDGLIMSVAGTGKLWINAFVPPSRAKQVRVDAPALVYPTTGGKPLAGRITAGGGLEYKVHPSLRDRITDFSAVYVRVDLDDAAPDLIPGNVVQVVMK